jgi:plastocyanin
MSGDVFSPDSIQIVEGSTVVWRNNDDDVHPVTASEGSFDSGDLDPGETFTRTFSSTGTFAYFCQHHSAWQEL